MSAYRFCRTDDIGLLVEALNRCWLPGFPADAPMTPAAFKQWIRLQQVWCSSCMVAFSGPDVIGVLIGAKRTSSTLVHTIAVHPEHRGQGHGRHLLASLASKLSILGPPRIAAEVPATLAPARELFRASGYIEEAQLTDYVLSADSLGPPAPATDRSGHAGPLVIPITVDDVVANGLLGDAERQLCCWERSVETLIARKDDIAGFALVADEQIEAYVLYRSSEVGAETELVSLRSFVDDGGARFGQLLWPLRARGLTTLTLSKVHPSEIPSGWLEHVGFSAGASHILYAADARST